VNKVELDVGDIVIIEWIDACGGSGWITKKKLRTKPNQIISTGGVAVNTEVSITITQSYDKTSGHVDNYITVPWVNVTAVHVL
jgi:hypothetical protein